MRDWFVYYNIEFYPYAEIVRAEKALDAVHHPDRDFVVCPAGALCYSPDLDSAKRTYDALWQEGAIQ